jgi:large subunit ribosomal protein L25
MPDTKLKVELRSEKGSRPAGRLRREGRLPGVVYGLGEESVSVTVNAHQLGTILSSKSGANTLITLQIDGHDQLALARQIQRDAVKGSLVHVDFIRVRADQTIQAEVRIDLQGEAEGLSQGGMLEQMMHTLTVEGKPGQLPNEIAHDVSALEVGDQLHVKDLAIPAGITVVNDSEDLIATISLPRGLEEEEAAAEEGEEGEAAEGAEGAEGEAGEGAEATSEGDAESSE